MPYKNGIWYPDPNAGNLSVQGGAPSGADTTDISGGGTGLPQGYSSPFMSGYQPSYIGAGPNGFGQPGVSQVTGEQAAVAVAPGLLGLGLGIKQLIDAKKVRVEDNIKQIDRDRFGAAGLAKNSALVANNAQSQDAITRRENTATGNAMARTTSPSQAIQAISNIQANSNMSEQNLQSQGLLTQQGRIDRFDQAGQVLTAQQEADRLAAARKKAALTEGGWRNIGGFANTASSAAMMALPNPGVPA